MTLKLPDLVVSAAFAASLSGFIRNNAISRPAPLLAAMAQTFSNALRRSALLAANAAL